MKPDTTLTLGDFEFARYEIPEQIPFGGEQRLVVHELVGGVRIIDALGGVPTTIEWSGVFVGQNALDRALYLDGLRKSGQAQQLDWSGLSYRVVIKSLVCEFQRFYRIPYRLICEVCEDLTAPVLSLSSPSIDQLIDDDMATVSDLSGGIGDGTLSALSSTLKSAISSVSSFAAASQSTLTSVLTPIANVRAQAGILLQSANATIQNVATLGGVAPSNPIAQQASRLAGQISAVTQSENLINLDRALGRMATNIGVINSGTKQTTVAGGDLYSVAVLQYGDAMGWTSIAQANGLTDPQITGVAALSVPPLNDTGGVVNV